MAHCDALLVRLWTRIPRRNYAWQLGGYTFKCISYRYMRMKEYIAYFHVRDRSIEEDKDKL